MVNSWGEADRSRPQWDVSPVWNDDDCQGRDPPDVDSLWHWRLPHIVAAVAVYLGRPETNWKNVVDCGLALQEDLARGIKFCINNLWNLPITVQCVRRWRRTWVVVVAHCELLGINIQFICHTPSTTWGCTTAITITNTTTTTTHICTRFVTCFGYFSGLKTHKWINKHKYENVNWWGVVYIFIYIFR